MKLFVYTNIITSRIAPKGFPVLLILALTMFTSCVPIREYNSKVAELEALNASNKNIKKEIKVLEKDNRILLDTIHKRLDRVNALEIALKKKMDEIKIKVSIQKDRLKVLQIREPDREEWALTWISEHTFRDTQSARSTTWLPQKEKEVYYYLNKARLDPKGFCNKYILPRLKNDTDNIYKITLVNYMYSMIPLNALKPAKEEWISAKCHSETSGKTGYTGHTRQDKTCHSTFSGECCSYGLNDPLEIVIQLLIDENVTSLGHRYICLGLYSEVGISIAPHKTWDYNCVLDFN